MLLRSTWLTLLRMMIILLQKSFVIISVSSFDVATISTGKYVIYLMVTAKVLAIHHCACTLKNFWHCFSGNNDVIWPHRVTYISLLIIYGVIWRHMMSCGIQLELYMYMYACYFGTKRLDRHKVILSDMYVNWRHTTSYKARYVYVCL